MFSKEDAWASKGMCEFVGPKKKETNKDSWMPVNCTAMII